MADRDLEEETRAALARVRLVVLDVDGTLTDGRIHYVADREMQVFDVKDGQAGHFVFYEIWSTRELWQAHMGTEHVKALLVAAEQFADKVVVHELAHVGSPQ